MRLRSLLLVLLAAALAGGPVLDVAHAGKADVRAARKARKRLAKTMKKAGLSRLPASSSALASGGTAPLVSGTPPTLVTIPDADVATLFWAPGVVSAVGDGSADGTQCTEFWTGTADGQSGGMGACNMAQSLGSSFGVLGDGDSSLCHMKRLPTAENLASGGLEVLSGSFPGGDPTRLFSVPAREPRTVEARIAGQQRVFLRIASASANRAADRLYAVDLWFCPASSGPAQGWHTIALSTAGALTIEAHENAQDGGVHELSVAGFVTGDGVDVTWDTTRPRTATAGFSRLGGGFKSAIVVDGDRIAAKSRDEFGDQLRLAYTVTQFSGTTPETVRFLTGAFKETDPQQGRSFASATEFRDGFYAAAPASPLLPELDAVDLATDPFYASAPPSSVDASAWSCDVAADVVLAVHMDDPTMAAAFAPCETRPFDGMDFCWDDAAVAAASQAWPGTCGGS